MPGVVNQSGTAVTGGDTGPHAVGAAHPAPAPVLQPLSAATPSSSSPSRQKTGSHSPKMTRRNNTPNDVCHFLLHFVINALNGLYSHINNIRTSQYFHNIQLDKL